MQIIIDIPEEIYKGTMLIKEERGIEHDDVIQIPLESIANGTVLPEHHGNLVDIDEITKDDKTFSDSFIRYMDARTGKTRIVCIAPTILEADEEQEE